VGCSIFSEAAELGSSLARLEHLRVKGETGKKGLEGRGKVGGVDQDRTDTDTDTGHNHACDHTGCTEGDVNTDEGTYIRTGAIKRAAYGSVEAMSWPETGPSLSEMGTPLTLEDRHNLGDHSFMLGGQRWLNPTCVARLIGANLSYVAAVGTHPTLIPILPSSKTALCAPHTYMLLFL